MVHRSADPDAYAEGLKNLTPEELQELDQFITPRLAQLLTKAFPDAAQLLAPFIVGETGAGPAAIGPGAVPGVGPNAIGPPAERPIPIRPPRAVPPTGAAPAAGGVTRPPTGIVPASNIAANRSANSGRTGLRRVGRY